VYGGELTAYNWRTDELTAVASGETFVDRRDEKFIDPGQSTEPDHHASNR